MNNWCMVLVISTVERLQLTFILTILARYLFLSDFFPTWNKRKLGSRGNLAQYTHVDKTKENQDSEFKTTNLFPSNPFFFVHI